MFLGTNVSADTELTLNPRDLKHHSDLAVRVGAYGGQAVTGILAQVCFILSEPRGSPNLFCGYFPIPQLLEQIHSAVSRMPTMAP